QQENPSVVASVNAIGVVRLCRSGFLHQDVRVCAAEAKGVDPGDGRSVPVWPGLKSIRNYQAQLVEGDGGTRLDEMEVGRNLSMTQTEGDFDETGDASGCFEVADVRLDRPDHEGCISIAAGREDVADRARLYWIADDGSGTVGLQVSDLASLDTGDGKRF